MSAPHGMLRTAGAARRACHGRCGPDRAPAPNSGLNKEEIRIYIVNPVWMLTLHGSIEKHSHESGALSSSVINDEELSKPHVI